MEQEPLQKNKKRQKGIVGLTFKSFDEKYQLEGKGKILCFVEPSIYLVEFYHETDRSLNTIKLTTIEEMWGWQFFRKIYNNSYNH